MQFFEYTARWFKGEAFEGGMLAIFGALIVILALYFWKFGHMPTSRALVVPFLVVGLLWSLAGGVGIYVNTKRLESFRAEYERDPVAFVMSEKARVEEFDKWYRPLLLGWSVLLLVGLLLFHVWGGDLGRAAGIAVILFAVGGLMVDHTSESNARAYYAKITSAADS